MLDTISKGSQEPFGLVVFAAFVAASLLFLGNFDFGFRATADQIDYTYSALTLSPLEWLIKGADSAQFKGRIGETFVRPLQYLGGWIGDTWPYPILCVGILATIVGCFVAWIDWITRSKVALGLFAVYLALLPLGLHHWLPNAYPMQFLPLATGLLCRTAFQRFFSAAWAGLWFRLPMAAGIFLGAISFETSFTLMTLMTALELALFFSSRARSYLPDRGYVIWQALITALAIVAFALYRFRYPSGYAGNQLPTDPLPALAVSTALHLYYALSVAPILDANWTQLLIDVPRMIEAVVVAVGLAAAVFFVHPNRGDWRVLTPFGIVVALAVTIPISANHKYVDWCLNGSECTYLDARFSLLGTALILFFTATAVLPNRFFRPGFALIVGCFGALTFIVDAAASDHLQQISAGERLARAYVCSHRTPTLSESDLIGQLVSMPVTFHPRHDDTYKQQYWQLYISHLRATRFWTCPVIGLW